jgi:3-oxoadipate enol-lactonase
MSRQLTRGQREYAGLMGSRPEEGLAEVRLRSPQLYDAVVEGAFGQVMAQAGLSRAAREMTTVALLAAAGGAECQLATHVRAALRHAVAPAELRGLCELVAVYAGFPRGLNALEVIDRVLTQDGVPGPPALRRVGLADHETLVAQSGETGPAVVLVHALGLDWRMWAPVLERLSPGRRVYAYDLRGHGWATGSPVPFSLDDAAADLIGVLDALGLGQAHLVGLSYGGGIAQTAALAYPGGSSR